MIDHKHTDEIVCPYCGHHHEPEGEDFSETESRTDCASCDGEFTVNCSMSYSFSTSPFGPEEKVAEAAYQEKRAALRAPAERERAETDALAATFTPGTRVRVIDSHPHRGGWTGAVVNTERRECLVLCRLESGDGARITIGMIPRHLERM